MEYKYAYSTKELFAKLRIFDLIADVNNFSSKPSGRNQIDLAVNFEQSHLWKPVMVETLMNFHYKLKSQPQESDYGKYCWLNVYSPYSRVEVNLSIESVVIHFQ